MTTPSLQRIALHVAVRPRLWPAALRAAWRFRRRGWWRRPPFLPLPPPEYVAWRMHTAYGETGRGPTSHELERYLLWTRRMTRHRRSG